MRKKLLLLIAAICGIGWLSASAQLDTTSDQSTKMGYVSTSLVDMYNHVAPFPAASTRGYIDSLISIASPQYPLEINIKLNPDLTKEEQDFTKIFNEVGINTVYNQLFQDTFISNLGFLCYQLCIPMKVNMISEYNPEGYPLLISWEMLKIIYEPFHEQEIQKNN